jgi:hypothetical protein
LPANCRRGDDKRIRNPRRAPIRNRHRVGNHEECKQQKRAVAELMPPNGPRLAKQHDSQRDETQKRAEKHPADVQPPRACRDDGAEHQQPDRKREIVTPLTRRYPRSGDQSNRQDDAEIRGVVQVLAMDAQHELRGHC